MFKKMFIESTIVEVSGISDKYTKDMKTFIDIYKKLHKINKNGLVLTQHTQGFNDIEDTELRKVIIELTKNNISGIVSFAKDVYINKKYDDINSRAKFWGVKLPQIRKNTKLLKKYYDILR